MRLKKKKSMNGQRALHKRQVFVMLSVGFPLDNSPPKRSCPPRPSCIGLTHCISIFRVTVFLRLRDTQSFHFHRPFPGLALGPLRPSRDSGLRLPAAVAAWAPPGRCALLWYSRPARESPNKSAGLKYDSSGSGQSSRAGEGGRSAGAEVGLNGGMGIKGGYKRGELGLGAQEPKQGAGEDRTAARSGEGTTGWTRLQAPGREGARREF